MRFVLDIKQTLILSGLIHLFLIAPISKNWFLTARMPELEIDLPKIEFEFFQAAPKEEKHFFIPKNFQDTPEINTSPLFSDSEIPPLPATGPQGEATPFLEETWDDEPTPSEKLPPSLEEQTAIPAVEEPTSASVTSTVDLEKQEDANKTRWDYCNRIRTLVENNIQFPVNLKNQNIADIVKVHITLNREGKLVPGTLKIAQDCASRYLEINTQAIEGVYRASLFFPPIPKRYPKNEITFTLPIRFDGSTQIQKQ
jgi:hypothetical protein